MSFREYIFFGTAENRTKPVRNLRKKTQNNSNQKYMQCDQSCGLKRKLHSFHLIWIIQYILGKQHANRNQCDEKSEINDKKKLRGSNLSGMAKIQQKAHTHANCDEFSIVFQTRIWCGFLF